ncbi:MAG: hypothetical protein CBC82_01520 [Cellvibrionales bacterium TMED122]|nr:hypothetical protein [Halieaceae bacterium]OUV67276.1 MAG: hypothetical protein CBC82_01520 [Cellvibrionales bacterium TMED122]
MARIITDLARCLAIHIFALVIGDTLSLPVDGVCERSSATLGLRAWRHSFDADGSSRGASSVHWRMLGNAIETNHAMIDSLS